MRINDPGDGKTVFGFRIFNSMTAGQNCSGFMHLVGPTP